MILLQGFEIHNTCCFPFCPEIYAQEGKNLKKEMFQDAHFHHFSFAEQTSYSQICKNLPLAMPSHVYVTQPPGISDFGLMDSAFELALFRHPYTVALQQLVIILLQCSPFLPPSPRRSTRALREPQSGRRYRVTHPLVRPIQAVLPSAYIPPSEARGCPNRRKAITPRPLWCPWSRSPPGTGCGS